MGSTRHLMSKTPEYKAWISMKTRCYKPKTARFSRYGGRGIIVCDRWLNSFENFYADMGKRPNNKYSLDRLDSNKNYCPKNCKWSTAKQQANNRTNNANYTFKGVTKSISMWAEEYNINKHTLFNRIQRGWTIEDTLLKPVRRLKNENS